MFKFLGNLLGKKEATEEGIQGNEQPQNNEAVEPVDEQAAALALEEELTELPDEKSMQENPNGTVAVIGGKVEIASPKEGGIPARIQPGKGVKVLINGQEIKKITPVIAEDMVELVVANQEPVRRLEVEVSPDRMSAYLVMIMEAGIKSTLADYPPSNRLLVEADVEEIQPQPMTLEEVLIAVQEAGVTYGIDRLTLESAIQASDGKPALVAQGKPFIPGKDGYIEYLFKDEDKKMVPSVEEGEVVAVKHLPEPGEDGMDILGNAVPAPPVKDRELKIDKGVVLSDDGLTAIATESGRPMIGGSGLYIDPIYTINGDVVLDKGPLIFKGHLIIMRSVHEGVKIETLGDLEVKGGVHQAEILSGGKIIIHKNLIDSQVFSGRFRLVYDSLVAKLHQLNGQTKDLLDAAMQLRAKILAGAAQEITEGKIINVLLSSRFPAFFKLIKQITEEVEPIEKYLADQLKESLAKVSIYQKNPPEKINDLPKLYQDVNNVIKSLGNYFANATADISVYYVQNSHLESSGSIYINGLGCYNSQLIGKGEVKVEGQPGIFRGGKIVAGDNVLIQQLGCPSGSPTHIEVPADKKIEAAFIHPGVVLKVGDKIYRNDNPSKAFDVYQDGEGNLQVTKLKGE